jgi:hypothetical protein
VSSRRVKKERTHVRVQDRAGGDRVAWEKAQDERVYEEYGGEYKVTQGLCVFCQCRYPIKDRPTYSQRFRYRSKIDKLTGHGKSVHRSPWNLTHP